MIYFISDRDLTQNIWSFDVASRTLAQLTTFEGTGVKELSGHNETLVFEQAGRIHTLDTSTNEVTTLEITVRGDFPWAETRWEEVGPSAGAPALSPVRKAGTFPGSR